MDDQTIDVSYTRYTDEDFDRMRRVYREALAYKQVSKDGFWYRLSYYYFLNWLPTDRDNDPAVAKSNSIQIDREEVATIDEVIRYAEYVDSIVTGVKR